MRRLLQSRWVIGAMLVVASMAGCGNDIFAPPDDKVTVLNAMQDTIAFEIWSADRAALVDPSPFPPKRSAFEGRTVAPGRSRRVPVSEISGYARNADFVIFSWRIRGDTIRYGPTVQWTAAEQRKSAYRVAIEERATID